MLFSLEESNFNTSSMVEVDIAKNPAAVQAALWDTDVDVDFQTFGGFTTIGPRFHGGAHVGAVYLAQRLVTQYAGYSRAGRRRQT